MRAVRVGTATMETDFGEGLGAVEKTLAEVSGSGIRRARSSGGEKFRGGGVTRDNRIEQVGEGFGFGGDAVGERDVEGGGDALHELDALETPQAEIALEMRGGLDLLRQAMTAQLGEELGDDAGDLLLDGDAVELGSRSGHKAVTSD